MHCGGANAGGSAPHPKSGLTLSIPTLPKARANANPLPPATQRLASRFSQCDLYNDPFGQTEALTGAPSGLTPAGHCHLRGNATCWAIPKNGALPPAGHCHQLTLSLLGPSRAVAKGCGSDTTRVVATTARRLVPTLGMGMSRPAAVSTVLRLGCRALRRHSCHIHCHCCPVPHTLRIFSLGSPCPPSDTRCRALARVLGCSKLPPSKHHHNAGHCHQHWYDNANTAPCRQA